jgi:hypothetical protein
VAGGSNSIRKGSQGKRQRSRGNKKTKGDAEQSKVNEKEKKT